MEDKSVMTVRGKPKYLEKFLSQGHYVQHKPHTDCYGTEPGPPKRQADDQLP